MKQRAIFLATVLAGATPGWALGAGLGNLTYTAAELEKPIANFGGTGPGRFPVGPSGSNTVLMLRNVMIVMGSLDSGVPPGAFHVYDVSNPRAPKLLKSLAGTPETAKLRELHAMPLAVIDGKDILAVPTTTGVQFFDFTDPMNPAPAGTLALPGANGGDYDNADWMLSWAWPYLYVGGTGNGAFIVNAADPARASVVRRVTTGEMGNFRVGPTYAAGNYMVVANMDQSPTRISVVDVGVPSAPFLLTTGSVPINLYSLVVIGDRIYGSGTNGDYGFIRWSPTGIASIAQPRSGSDRGGYCTFQSGFAICGQSSEGYKKWDVRNESAIVQVGHGTDPAGAGGDFDFATILGNLVYLGNDHGSGAALIPHQMAPDTVAPQVVKAYPNDGDVKQPVSTRVTVFFSEDIDIGTMTSASLIVRRVGGAALDGVYSRSSFNAVSFGARQPLEANTTYEIVIPAGGLKDLVGNGIATATLSRFSTGPTIQTTPVGGIGGATGAGGGRTVDGGSTGAGGTSGVGGARTADGGATGAGGALAGSSGGNGAGGSPATGTGGSPSSAGTGGAAPREATSGAGGCGCRLAGDQTWTGTLLLMAAAFVMGRRRLKRVTRK